MHISISLCLEPCHLEATAKELEIPTRATKGEHKDSCGRQHALWYMGGVCPMSQSKPEHPMAMSGTWGGDPKFIDSQRETGSAGSKGLDKVKICFCLQVLTWCTLESCGIHNPDFRQQRWRECAGAADSWMTQNCSQVRTYINSSSSVSIAVAPCSSTGGTESKVFWMGRFAGVSPAVRGCSPTSVCSLFQWMHTSSEPVLWTGSPGPFTCPVYRGTSSILQLVEKTLLAPGSRAEPSAMFGVTSVY